MAGVLGTVCNACHLEYCILTSQNVTCENILCGTFFM